MSKIRHTPQAPTRTQLLTAGQEIDAHRHNDHQLIYSASGAVAVTTAAGTWLAPGSRAIWIPAATVHAHRAYGPVDLHLLGLPATDNPLNLTAPAVLTVNRLLRELIVAFTREPGDDSPPRQRLRVVLLDQLRVCQQQPVHLPTATDRRLATVCAALHDDPADNRKLPDFSAAAGASTRTLTRLFRDEFGMTFPQWRTQLRLFHAVRLLAEGCAVTTVAQRCGWASTSAFIDVFRRAFGHTPGTHRHQD